MGYTIVREEAADLRDEWLALLDGGQAAKVFQHPVWQQVWTEEFGSGREPLLVAVRDGDRVIGIASLLRRDDRLSFLGDPNICDYMDFVLAPGLESRALSLFAGWLLEQEWDEVELWGLPHDSPTLALLPAIARDLRLRVRVELEAVCPQLELPPDWESYLARLTKKNRHELRRKIRRLQKTALDTRLSRLSGPGEVASGMDDFLSLMVLKSDKAQFMTPQMEGFFRRVASALGEISLATLYMLEVDGRRVASAFCFEDSAGLMVYNSGYDPSLSHLAVGLLSKALVLQNAIENGRRWVNFLRGNEPYKYDLGATDGEVYRCLINRP